MAKQRDYYEVLGVARTASDQEIKSAYRKLARELHPDINKAKDAAERFNEVQQAYEVLQDAEKRKAYDRYGHDAPGFGFGAGPEGASGGGRRAHYSWTNVGGESSEGRDFGDADFGSIFEEIFGAEGARAAGGPFGKGFGSQAKARSKPSRGRDVTHDITVDFMTAALGGTETLRVQRGGTTQTIDVTIPRAIKDGSKLRIRGAGSPSAGGSTAGDLILTVHIGAHPVFKRNELDLMIDLPLTIAEATLGTTVSVPTLTGKAELTVPAGTNSGQRLRLRGQGLRAESGETGDFLATIKIVTPTGLSEADQQALRSIGQKQPSPRVGPGWT